VRSPFQRKRKTPKEAIRFGEFGINFVRWLGESGCDFRGRITGQLYAFTELHPVKPVDKRDLPGLAKEGGRENFEGLHDVKADEMRQLRQVSKTARESEPESGEQMEVDNAKKLDNDGE